MRTLVNTVLFAVLVILGCLGEASAELTYEVRIGASYSDNIRRSDADEEDETIAVGGLNVDWAAESRRFTGAFDADFEYRDYLDDTFESDNVSSADLNLEFKAAPDVFHWVVDNRFGTLRRNPFDAETPGNRENVNRLSTGPDFFARLGRKTRLAIQGRYASTNYEESDADSETLDGTVSLQRAVSPNRTLSLNLSAARVEFDDVQGTSGFDQYSAYVSINSEISRGTLRASLGANEVHDRGDVFSGTFAELEWARQLSSLSRLTLSYSLRYSDAGDLFGRFDGLGTGTSRVREIVPVTDPLEVSRLAVTYRYNKNNVTYLLSAFASDDDYEVQNGLDRQRLGANADVSADFGRGWRLGADLGFRQSSFDTPDRSDDYLTGGVRIDRRLSRLFWISLQYNLDDRSSDAEAQDYRENRVTLWLRFRPTD